MVGILSIDFDYFIDVSSRERDRYFPNGEDDLTNHMLQSIWKEKYLRYRKLKKVGVIDDFYFLKKYLREVKVSKENIEKADSHKYIKHMIDQIPRQLQLRIVNIDFHHDYYHYFKGSDTCNCGNWLRRVIEERPNTDVTWIRRKDSQVYSLDGIVPFEHTEDITSICKDKFDYIFLCKSPEWSPPHLYNRYEELVSCVATKLSLIS